MTDGLDQREAYADPVAVADERATRHGRIAKEMVQRDPEGPLVALTQAVLALEARLDELAGHVARLT